MFLFRCAAIRGAWHQPATLIYIIIRGSSAARCRPSDCARRFRWANGFFRTESNHPPLACLCPRPHESLTHIYKHYTYIPTHAYTYIHVYENTNTRQLFLRFFQIILFFFFFIFFRLCSSRFLSRSYYYQQFLVFMFVWCVFYVL